MGSEQNQIKKAVANMGTDVNHMTVEDREVLRKKITDKGVMPKDILGMSDAMVEGLYAQAYRLYNTGKYKEASQLFRILMMVNVMEPKYAMGFAACFHMMKEYKSAAEAYTVCSVMDPDNPVPHFHASDCFLQLNDPLAAIIELDMAVQRASLRPEFHTLKDRALLMIESIKKDMSEKESNKEK